MLLKFKNVNIHDNHMMQKDFTGIVIYISILLQLLINKFI